MSDDRTGVPATPNRRTFLSGAAVAAGAGAGITGFPYIARAQEATVLKMQGAWAGGDIFNDMATEYVERVNRMSGGSLQIEYLLGGAVVKPFSVQDAVNDGILDGGHQVCVYWYGKHKAASLFGTGPVFGWDATQGLAWMKRGGGQELYNELVQEILGLDLVGFFAMPMPAQPLGWFTEAPLTPDDLRGLKYRTVGLAADLFQQMGLSVAQLPGGEILPAMERGVIDAFEFNNPTSDRRFGAQDVAKNYMLSSYHQATEYFEIIFNKTKFESLPDEHQAILQYAAEAASTSNLATGLDTYSSDLNWLETEAGVKVQRTSQAILDAQLQAWDALIPVLEEDEFMQRVLDSQRAWAERVGRYSLLNQVDYKLAYEHYFGSLNI
jgi:TRAP-type mannitol/chloroaromatic compound transport system substrate-binding protein